MKSVLLTELAVLIHLKSVRVILLVLLRVVVSLLAFSTSERDLNSHFSAPPDEICILQERAECVCLPQAHIRRCKKPTSLHSYEVTYVLSRILGVCNALNTQKNRPHKEVQLLYHIKVCLSSRFINFL